MADLVTIQKWDDDSASSSSQYIETRDEDFGSPAVYKRIYGVVITYKASAATTMNVMLTYAMNGNTSYISTYVPTTAVGSTAIWDVATIMFTTVLEVQSLRCKIAIPTGTGEINDISVIYRTIHKRVT